MRRDIYVSEKPDTSMSRTGKCHIHSQHCENLKCHIVNIHGEANQFPNHRIKNLRNVNIYDMIIFESRSQGSYLHNDHLGLSKATSADMRKLKSRKSWNYHRSHHHKKLMSCLEYLYGRGYSMLCLQITKTQPLGMKSQKHRNRKKNCMFVFHVKLQYTNSHSNLILSLRATVLYIHLHCHLGTFNSCSSAQSSIIFQVK
jgi:hypothetical protein